MSDAPRRAPYVHRMKVRYSETDQMGIVHHANYLVYLEEARTAVMRSRSSPYGELEKTGVGLPVRHIDIRYRTPIFFDDVIYVAVWVERVRGASATFGYEIVRDDGRDEPTTIATASVELACFDLETRKPRLLPDRMRESLSTGARQEDWTADKVGAIRGAESNA